MSYKIIVTLGEEELLDYKNPAIKEADILEIRLDLLEISFIKEKLSSILKELAKPILFTYRNPKDSSESKSTKLVYEDISDLLLEFNSEENYLDIEIDQKKSIFDSIPDSRYTVIYSYHNFSNSISRDFIIYCISQKIKLPGKKIFKFAVTENSTNRMRDFLINIKYYSEEVKVPIIGIVMGEIGVYSRIFGDRFGSFATYCCIGKPRAPGQVNISTLRKIREEYKNKPLPEMSFRFPIMNEM